MPSTRAQTQPRTFPRSSPQKNSRSSGNVSRHGNHPPTCRAEPPPSTSSTSVKANGPKSEDDVQEAQSGEGLCFICAEPVKYFSVSECNHRTCHICALRLRALYKRMDCTFCKEPQPILIYTTSSDAPFSSFSPETMPHRDKKLSIYFETHEAMEETMILLRFNCPDPDCSYISTGWDVLNVHVRGIHGKTLCNLCLRRKKIFAHEHVLYAQQQLPLHMPSLQHRPLKSTVPPDQIEGGVHPMCQFCSECYFDDDDLFAHLREKHEECFICKRNGVRDQYFTNYEGLEKHFTRAHHGCTHPLCLARKFVVFNTQMDLQAHTVEEHSGEMTTRDRKDARRVAADFDFDEAGVKGRRGNRRENEQDQPSSAPGPSRSIPKPGGLRSREAFGASLTVERTEAPQPLNPDISRRMSPSPPPTNADPDYPERYAAFIARIWAQAPNPETAVSALKASLRGYRASELTARDLISTTWSALDQKLEATSSVMSALADLLDEQKKKDLLSSWNGFRIEQRRQFPELVPSAGGSAGIASRRVVNIKNATTSKSSRQSPRQVWDRVAEAAGSSISRPPEKFPALSSAVHVPTQHRHQQRNTPWVPSSQSAQKNTALFLAPGTAQTPGSESDHVGMSFPQLASIGMGKSKSAESGNMSPWKTFGPPRSTGLAGASTSSQKDGEDDGGDERGKKGKGKQKHTLFTLGSVSRT